MGLEGKGSESFNSRSRWYGVVVRGGGRFSLRGNTIYVLFVVGKVFIVLVEVGLFSVMV